MLQFIGLGALFEACIFVAEHDVARKMSKYGVISGPYFPAFGPEITSYLNIFYAV